MASHTPIRPRNSREYKSTDDAMSFSEGLGELRAKDGYELMDLLCLEGAEAIEQQG